MCLTIWGGPAPAPPKDPLTQCPEWVGSMFPSGPRWRHPLRPLSTHGGHWSEVESERLLSVKRRRDRLREVRMKKRERDEQQAREIERNQAALRRSIQETSRLVNESEAMLRRHKTERLEDERED